MEVSELYCILVSEHNRIHDGNGRKLSSVDCSYPGDFPSAEVQRFPKPPRLQSLSHYIPNCSRAALVPRTVRDSRDYKSMANCYRKILL